MNVGKMFESEWIKGSDLPGNGVSVVISKTEFVIFKGQNGQPDETKVALSFEGRKKKLTLNKTNGKRLVDWYGEDASAWVGKQVHLAPVPTSSGQTGVLVNRVDSNEQEEIPF